MPILGTAPDAIDLAEDRDRFKALLDEQLELKPSPVNGIARSVTTKPAPSSPRSSATPSSSAPPTYWAGARWKSCATMRQFERYIREAVVVSGDTPGPHRHLSDQRHRTRRRLPLRQRGRRASSAGIMEHIEEAGIHSGDSRLHPAAPAPFRRGHVMDDQSERQTDRPRQTPSGVVGPDECAISR